MKKSRILSLILTVAMMVTMMTGFAVAATGTDGTITITNAAKDTTYKAYKIFDADVTGEGDSKITIYTIAKDANTAALALLQGTTSPFTLIDDTDKYIVSVKDGKENKDVIDFIKANLATLGNLSTPSEKSATADGTLAFENLSYGYYYVTSTMGSVVSIDSATKNATITDKNPGDTPHWSEDPTKPDSKDTGNGKFVWDEDKAGDDKWNNANDATMGVDNQFALTAVAPKLIKNAKEVVTYKITDYYGNYFDTVAVTSVKIDGKEQKSNCTVTVDEANGKFTVVIDVDKIGTDYTDGKIIILYTARLNEKATIGSVGNINKADLTWTAVPYDPDKPYDSQTTDPDDPRTPVSPTKPDPENPNGPEVPNTDYPSDPEHPESPVPPTVQTKTYTYMFDLLKVEKGKTEKLDGAEFNLKDNAGNILKFELIGGAYVASDATTASATISAGEVTIKGLDAGTYTLTETKTPSSKYSKADDVDVTIDGTRATTNDSTTLKITVENVKSTDLPSTGGIGTTIFYIIGSVLVIGAVVLFITKKRMDANK